MKGSDFHKAVAILIFVIVTGCSSHPSANTAKLTVRPLKDTIGFAQYPWQMDSIMARIHRAGWTAHPGAPLKLAICPHDDYTYVGSLYPELLQNVKAPTLILLGVAHKAAAMKIEDSLVFDSYTYWKGPWKNVPVSPAREEIYGLLAGKYAIVNDSLHKVEHSVEAMIPFLQYFDKNVSIVPILVPAMSPDRMEACGKALADAISGVAKKNHWQWGRDYAIVVTTDAVHYGNEDWGGKDMAFYGCDREGNMKALAHELEIIDSCLINALTPLRIRKFSSYTLDDKDYRQYKWTWCGRYSVPVALYASFYLSGTAEMNGELSGYYTSITSPHIGVDDIGMGRTAIATACHWVGYAALGYR
jgi:MEMO1 family protein